MAGVVMSAPRRLLGNSRWFLTFNEWIVSCSGMPIAFGLTLASIDLFVLPGRKRSPVLDVRNDLLPSRRGG